MNVSEIATRMIKYSKGNLHDINHFMKVYAYAKTIGECENLDSKTQEVLEVAAIMHDIACPLCREKYGNTNGQYQESEGSILAEEFLEGSGYSDEFIERVVFLIGHHHTLKDITGMDYQILIEADYLVNADEGKGSNNMIAKVKYKSCYFDNKLLTYQ
jgi:HD superfamily phosphodiesterase